MVSGRQKRYFEKKCEQQQVATHRLRRPEVKPICLYCPNPERAESGRAVGQQSVKFQDRSELSSDGRKMQVPSASAKMSTLAAVVIAPGFSDPAAPQYQA